MIRAIAAAALLSMSVSVLPAYAADESVATSATSTGAAQLKVARALSRPKALPALYVSYAALQALDFLATREALSRGGREANPLMQGVAGHTAVFLAFKVTVALATIGAAEHLWKRNKAAAIAVMVASNGVASAVAARNAHVLRQLP